MPDPSVSGVNANTPPVNPSAANPTTAGAAMTSNAQGEVNSKTRISSMKDLREKSPKLYNMMLQGIAMQICGEMQHHQARLKEMMRKSQRR